MIEEFIHKKAEAIRKPQDYIDLTIDGALAGRAKIKYSNEPFPLHWIEDLKVLKRGEGHGSKIMDYVEELLQRSNTAGVLLDNIPEDSPAHGMYERRGWQKIPGTKYGYAFNVPAGAKIEDLQPLVE